MSSAAESLVDSKSTSAPDVVLRPGVLILSGGQGTRCGNRDKGWLEIRGEALVVRRLRELSGNCWPLAISANRTFDRYCALGVPVFADTTPEFPGPLAAVSAALNAQFGNPLLTVPVDALTVSSAVLMRLLDASEGGQRPAYACDANGMQPLVAVWPANALARVDEALHERALSVRALQRRLRAVPVDFPGDRFGNINTQADLDTAERDSIRVAAC
ncbi:MAG: NTP transferase domain-containing protein [Lysobacterales bacterium]